MYHTSLALLANRWNNNEVIFFAYIALVSIC